MNSKIKELWVIPIIIAAVFMFLSLRIAGTPIHAPFSLRSALSTPLPMWVTLAVLAAATVITRLFFRQRAQLVSAIGSLESAENRIAKRNEEHVAEIEKLTAKEPRLHGVWNQSQTLWHMGRQGEAPAMQIVGWIDLTSSNTKEVMFLLAAYIGERRSQIFMDVEVKPNVVNRCMVMLFMVPPLEMDDTMPYDATIVVEDQYNRKFSLPFQRFRATPEQTAFPISVPVKPAPRDDEIQALKDQITTLKSSHFPLPSGPGWTQNTSPIDGQWLEIFDRNDAQRYSNIERYSIVRVEYDAASHGHPYSMTGDSLYCTYDYPQSWLHHSHWNTRYVRLEQNGDISLEYIFSATIAGETKHGYGISHFMPEGGKNLVRGNGKYIAVEEPTLRWYTYSLKRIDDDLRRNIGASAEPLDTLASMQSFVKKAHEYFSSNRERL
jgi:hypothetical protein